MISQMDIFRRILLLSSAGILATGIFGSSAGAAPVASVPDALAGQVQHVLGMHHGDSPYLADYRICLNNLLAAAKVFRTRRETQSQYLRRIDSNTQLRDASALLVKAFADGADAEAIRNRVMASLNLRGRSVGTAHARWPYGQMLDRMQVMNYLLAHARSMDSKGEIAEARMWARTAFLLYTQDSIFGGAAAWGNWFNPSAFPEAAINEKMLGIDHAQRRALKRLYQNSLRRENWLHTLGIAPIQTFTDSISVTAGRSVSKRRLARFTHTLAILIRKTDGRLSEQFFLLRCVAGAIRRLSSGGHARAASVVIATLVRWSSHVRGEKRLSKVDRASLLRWIREASL